MQENVIDIILKIYRRLIAGESLQEINHDDFATFQKSEFIAAYSYVLEKSQDKSHKSTPLVPRILHLAERLVITPEAYGYLLELNKLGVLSPSDLEYIIEKTMLNSVARIDLEAMKTLVAKHLFQSKQGLTGTNMNFSGSELAN